MNHKVLTQARTLVFSLVMTVALSAGCLAFVPAAMAQNVPNAPSISTDAEQPGNWVLAQSKSTKKKPDADPDAQRKEIQDYLKGIAEQIKQIPLVKRFFSVLPGLWTPIRIAIMLLFVGFYAGFHFKRQRRQQLEAEQNAQPSAVEREFGVETPDSYKEVSP